MGEKEMKLPTTCDGWATRVSALVKAATDALGVARFPIRIAPIAADYSRNLYPKEPITIVQGDDFGERFEGALVPKGNGEWGIFYNTGLRSKGRINFCQAHEFGHYLLHRHLSGNPFYCSRKDMWAWNSDYGRMEAEANRFASMVLMPPDDFRIQTYDFRKPTLSQFEALRERYEVSITAAVLKWLDMTRRRAMLVVSKDGFIDWARSSPALFKSGVYFPAKQLTIPLPGGSLAAIGRKAGTREIDHLAGVWNADEPVFESVLFDEYRDLALSLLIFPVDGPGRWDNSHDEESGLMDTFEAFQR
ncbi:ImmA/IrrE family metallo-endopeptidase [Mesorhizobium sp. M0701]|uniref:ImmA/IrrE family metallo-endopeptidase n=1 Tax=Mesorhizobium sp. M0701 TaxID=2956989 RepID=UPI00333DF1F7